jgi:hypothetical protein
MDVVLNDHPAAERRIEQGYQQQDHHAGRKRYFQPSNERGVITAAVRND